MLPMMDDTTQAAADHGNGAAIVGSRRTVVESVEVTV
jgi:hypothetical protein